MGAYWAMYLVFALPALVQRQSRHTNPIAWLLIGILLMWFIGYRHEVGGDWGNYLGRFIQYAYLRDWRDVLQESDPGYVYLNWQMAQWGYGIYAVNAICGVIFSIGLVAFARRQPYPWVAIAVAFPYLVMVVGMGYTRQGVAIGLILLSLNALQSRQFIRYLVFIALATLFHRTSLIMIPLGFFLFGRGWLFRAISILVAAYVLYDALVAEETEQLWATYVDAAMISQGAQIRVMMNLVPAAILLWSWRSWRTLFPDYWFWFLIAAGSVVCVLLVGFASTAVDRIALYFLPIQLAVFARLPLLLSHRIDPGVLRLGIVAGYALVLYVWLNYATHAGYWIPYDNLLFQ